MSDAFRPPPPQDRLSEPMSWLRQHAQKAPEGHWDELRNRLSADEGTATAPDSLWADFMAKLGPEGLAGLNPRMADLRRQVRDNGITYNVYAQTDQPQRPWALDLFPLMVTSSAWQQIERGVRQRMQLLEHIMRTPTVPRRWWPAACCPPRWCRATPATCTPCTACRRSAAAT